MSETGITETAADPTTVLSIPCQAAAPLVVNGAPFVGCQLPTGHPGQHEVIIHWDAR